MNKMQLWEKQIGFYQKLADIVAITFPRTKFAPKMQFILAIPLRKKKKISNLKTNRKGYLLLEEAKEQKFFLKLFLNY